MRRGAQYKQNLASLRAEVQEEMDTVKRRDNLEHVDVDPSELTLRA